MTSSLETPGQRSEMLSGMEGSMSQESPAGWGVQLLVQQTLEAWGDSPGPDPWSTRDEMPPLP